MGVVNEELRGEIQSARSSSNVEQVLRVGPSVSQSVSLFVNGGDASAATLALPNLWPGPWSGVAWNVVERVLDVVADQQVLLFSSAV